MRKAIITGAYGAIGKAIAKGVAEAGYDVTLVGRDEAALEACRGELTEQTGNRRISHAAVDLSDKDQIRAFAGTWDGPLHLLINNAVTAPRTRTETPGGIELQFATNVLGYFWMTRYFSEHMKGADDARIVNVASYWAGGLDINDLEFTRRPYDNDTVYRQCKQANRMLTVAFAERLKEHGIAVLAAHPGDVRSKLSNNLGHGGWESPEEGADTPLYCALDPDLKGVTGKYFAHRREEPCSFSGNRNEVEQLYAACAKY